MSNERKDGPRVSRRGAIAGFVATAASGVFVATNMDAAVAFAQQGSRRLVARGPVFEEPKGGFPEIFNQPASAMPEPVEKWPETEVEAAQAFSLDQKTRSQRWTKHTGDYKAYGDVPFYSVEPIEGGDILAIDTTDRGMAEIWYPRKDGSTFRAILHGIGITRGATVRPLIDSCDHPQVKRQELADRIGVSIDQVAVIGFPRTLTGR